jgi:hypothetical protein
MRLRSLPRILRRFARIGGRRRALLLEAVFWLALARAAVLTVRFSRIARRLGAFTPPAEGLARGAPPDPPSAQRALAGEIGWAVTRAARHVPFKAVCLPQAMAAQRMLRRRGITAVLFFGVARDAGGAVESHAWLLAAGVEVTGYPVANDFTAISCFV